MERLVGTNSSIAQEDPLNFHYLTLRKDTTRQRGFCHTWKASADEPTTPGPCQDERFSHGSVKDSDTS